MKRGWRVLKMMAVAISLMLSIAVLGVWGRSYWAEIQLCEIARESALGGVPVTVTGINVCVGSVRTEYTKALIAKEDVDGFLGDLDVGWRLSQLSLGIPWENAGEGMWQFDLASRTESRGQSGKTTMLRRSATFPAWLLLLVVSLPVDVAIFQCVLACRAKRRGFPVDAMNPRPLHD